MRVIFTGEPHFKPITAEAPFAPNTNRDVFHEPSARLVILRHRRGPSLRLRHRPQAWIRHRRPPTGISASRPTPDAWLTALDGTSGPQGLPAEFDAGFDDSSDVLEVAAALQLEARKGRWASWPMPSMRSSELRAIFPDR